MTPVLRRMILMAAKRLAADPRVRQKAFAAMEQARPRVEQAVRQIREIARETSPLDDPKSFAAKVRDQVIRKR